MNGGICISSRYAVYSLVFAVVACKGKPQQIPPQGAATPVVCTMEARAGLVIDVVDSVTGAPAIRGSKIVARSATGADSTHGEAQTDQPVALEYERAGTYVVTVSKPGYRQWTRLGIVVTRDECHVQTVRVLARLQRS